MARRGPRGSRIHRGLTGERALVGTRYLADAGLRREYADEIAPRTEAALARILAQLFTPGVPAPTRALDLGAGTGAASTTLRAWFGAALDVIAVDRVAGPGIVTADLARELPPVSGRFELIVSAHMLGELFLDQTPVARTEARARRVLAWCRALLAEGGTVILIEPALRETSRALLALRDRLIVAGLHVVAPCFLTGPCPALERERDWCHDSAPVPSAPRVDYSYLVLRAGAAPAVAPTALRVVSDPMPEKGRLKVFGCGPSGRHALVRLDRGASPVNSAFDQLRRGDAADVAGTLALPDGLRVTAETSVIPRAPLR